MASSLVAVDAASPRVSGYVTEVAVDDNQAVRRGDVLRDCEFQGNATRVDARGRAGRARRRHLLGPCVARSGERKDWFASGGIVLLACIAAVGLAAFVTIEVRRAQPLINLRLLAGYNFGVASLMQFLFGAVAFGVVFLVPNYLAEARGYSARDIGMTTIPYGLVQFAMSFLTPPLMRRTSPRMVIAAGLRRVQ